MNEKEKENLKERILLNYGNDITTPLIRPINKRGLK